ncbi:MAG TPA: serine/threonine-protein kinase, partial [Polyangiaceae bacterium]|nr:serine/threonine-protein kinase [Polyangiaceae bacterium]
GILYYAMELLDGATLQQIVEATGPLPAGRTVAVLRQAAGALSEAHELGLIHRDIKPANIMLCNQGGQVDVVKVLDFGLVKEIEGGDQTLTQGSAITGTPLYMSPEALKDPASVDARSDLYALGAVAYFLLTGDHVFKGTSLIEVCGKHLHEVPPAPSLRSGRQLPGELDELVLDCLAKDPALRPRTTRELARRLAAIDGEVWSIDQAEGWWHQYGASLKPERTSVSGTAQTIEVDIGRR